MTPNMPDLGPMIQNMMAKAVAANEVAQRGEEAIAAVQQQFKELDLDNVAVHQVTLQHNDSGKTTTIDVVDATKFAEVVHYASNAGMILCKSLNVNLDAHADKARLEQALMAIEALLQVTQDAETGRAIQQVIDMTREANG